MDLTTKKCVPCEGGLPPLPPEEVRRYAAQLTLPWEVSDDNKNIRHQFIFKDFKEAMGFVNAVAKLANEEDHHPDLHIFYNRVLIELSTHAMNGLSENDFILAAKIERLV